MKITATINNMAGDHRVVVSTNEAIKSVAIPAKTSGPGSSVNGGELLMLAIATCFCNDIYREAARRNIPVDGVTVEVTGEFEAEGEAGRNFSYRAKVNSSADPGVVDELIRATDQVAEIHNTLRQGIAVKLVT